MTRQQYIDIFKACTFCNEILDNFKNLDVECDYTRDLADLVKNYVPERWIDYAATWETTPQGECYWTDINNAWLAFIRSDGTDFSEIDTWYNPATSQGETFSVTMPKKAAIRLNFQL